MITNALNNTPALSVAVRRTIMDANTKGVTVVHDRLPLQLVYIMANFINFNHYKKNFWRPQLACTARVTVVESVCVSITHHI